MYYVSLAILIVSCVLYQLFQKSISPSANPGVSLLCSYVVAIVLALAIAVLFPGKTHGLAAIKDLNIFSALLALPIVGIELGYLLLYRYGGQLSVSSALVSAIVATILLVIGYAGFKENLEMRQVVGLVLCVGGIVLLNLK